MTDKIYQQNITVPEGAQLITRLHVAKHLKDYPHVRIFNDALLEIVFDTDMAGVDFRVLFYILGNLEWENYFKQSQAVMAAELDIQQPQVSRSIKKLLAKGWLRIEGQIGRQNIYRINPHLAIKSWSRNYSKFLEDWDFDSQAIAQES